uniref:hypothetical protein n=1 Tax=Ornithinimicrobium sufpigmenti TaxID=2508882 RepID=UPI0037CA0D74
MQVLRDLVEGDRGVVRDDVDPAEFEAVMAEDRAIWGEWERSSHGRRQITWSGGFRDLLGLGAERTDEELAEDDDAAGDVVLELEPAVFRSIVAAPPRLRGLAAVGHRPSRGAGPARAA